MQESRSSTSTTAALRVLAGVALSIAGLSGCAHATTSDDDLAQSGSSSADESDSSGTSVAAADPGEVREAIAGLHAASAAWDATCSRPGPHGLCVVVRPSSPGADRCGDRRLGEVDVSARATAAAQAAREALAAALADAAALGDPDDRDLAQALHDARGRAAVLHVDAELETYLALHAPEDLDFYVESWKKDSDEAMHRAQYDEQKAKVDDSMKRFKAFYEGKNELGASLIQTYAEVKASRSTTWVAQAALRTSWVGLHFADELRAAPLPPSLRTEEMRDAYCTALEDQALGPERIARDAARFCIDGSSDGDVAADAHAACRELLARLPAAK